MRTRLFFLLAIFTSPAQAGIIHVSDFSGLASAINSANLDSGSTIFLAPGTYSGGELPNVLASTTFQLDPAFNVEMVEASVDVVIAMADRRRRAQPG